MRFREGFFLNATKLIKGHMGLKQDFGVPGWVWCFLNGPSLSLPRQTKGYTLGAAVCLTLTWAVMRRNQLLGLRDLPRDTDLPQPCNQELGTPVEPHFTRGPAHLSATVFPHSGPGNKPEQVAMPCSRGSSWPRDQTRISCITGGFFTVWDTGKAPYHFLCYYIIFCVYWKSSLSQHPYISQAG